MPTIIDNLKEKVEEASKAALTEPPRTHLGASIIGHNCSAYVWNSFRWLKHEDFSGRMLRLFNRGQDEEKRLIKWLGLAGLAITETDPETGKQLKFSIHEGHFGGSLDGYAPKLLVEFKTHNTKSFVQLQKDGVKQYKPMHFAQMTCYGTAFNLPQALYVAVNKNDDDLYFETVDINPSYGQELFNKAGEIIFSQTQPRKIWKDKTYFECKYCHFSGICHDSHLPDKNCRSCSKASPVANAEWFCGQHGSIIPKDYIPLGCEQWNAIV